MKFILFLQKIPSGANRSSITQSKKQPLFSRMPCSTIDILADSMSITSNGMATTTSSPKKRQLRGFTDGPSTSSSLQLMSSCANDGSSSDPTCSDAEEAINSVDAMSRVSGTERGFINNTLKVGTVI